MRRSLSLVAATLVFAGPRFSAVGQRSVSLTRRVDSVIAAAMHYQHIPGLSLAVMRAGHLVYAKGYGLANTELNVPTTPATVFQSGSVGKQFTATLIMMLVESGKVNLSDPITRYFTDAPEAWKAITVRHLLTHTGGLAEDFSHADYQRDYTEDELARLAYRQPLESQPGETWRYSNVGYVLLGILIHRVTGHFYGDMLHDRIFAPLGMHTARVISEADIIPNRAAGYTQANCALRNQGWVSPTMNTTADGSLYLTVLDMAKWDAALYTEVLLKRSSLAQMWTPVTLNSGVQYPYGFGWKISRAGTHPVLEHDGQWQGFTSAIVRYPEQRMTVVILDNSGFANPIKIAHDVAQLYDPSTRPAAAPTIPDTEPQVTSLMRNLIRSVTAGKTDTALFAAGANIFGGSAGAVRCHLAWAGELAELRLLDRRMDGANRFYLYHARFADDGWNFELTLTPAGKVTEVHLRPE